MKDWGKYLVQAFFIILLYFVLLLVVNKRLKAVEKVRCEAWPVAGCVEVKQ